MASKKKMTMELIVGNRGFFPDHLAKTGREEMLQALQKAGFDVVAPTLERSKYGAVETHDEAKRCAELFRCKACVIDGGGHTWPGMPPPVSWIGLSTGNISANDLMWDFFKRHPLK